MLPWRKIKPDYKFMQQNRTISIAPMMKYTDRHYRVLMRIISPNTLLYTEMVTDHAVIHGIKEKLLGFSAIEHPIALQLGGSDPNTLVKAAEIGQRWGYDEINLNVGCPSDRVQSGKFGACLMKEPELVAAGIAAMQKAVDIPVTVKTRIGVDEFDDYAYLQRFIETVANQGCTTFIFHARKAWLNGLSPRENREIPPLKYDTVYRIKQDYPSLHVSINGGIKTLQEIKQHLQYVDGVMIGREAYGNPYLFAEIEAEIFNNPNSLSRSEVLSQYLVYMTNELAKGVSLRQLIRHTFGLFQGQPGAKNWRRYLTENASSNDLGIIETASSFLSLS